jgi:hypothetical protein
VFEDERGDYKEGGMGAHPVKSVEYLGSPDRVGAVIEGQDDLRRRDQRRNRARRMKYRSFPVVVVPDNHLF